MIALRKLFQVFGRGTLAFLNPSNRKVLAYLRQFTQGEDFCETVLCVANLSRFAQPVTLDLADYASRRRPVEMLGYVRFPTITREPYSLTLAPYSFLWLELQAASAVEEAPFDSEITNSGGRFKEEEMAVQAVFAKGWAEFIAGGGVAILEPSLLEWCHASDGSARKRTRSNQRVSASGVELGPDAKPGYSLQESGPSEPVAVRSALFFFDVTYFDGLPYVDQIPLAVSTGAALDEIAEW